jgi:hypothetical protein
MNMENHDKRNTKRVLFSAEDEASVYFYSYETDKIVSAKVVNMSAGGMCLALVKEDLKNIPKIGEKLVLLKLESPGELSYILNVNLEIVWALTPSPLDQIGIGCKFDQIPKKNELQIEEFIHSVSTKH